MIKKFVDHKKEMMYLAGAALLALAIIIYLFVLIHSLVKKANAVFGDIGPTTGASNYDFAKFKKLLPEPATSTSAVVATTTATSTPTSTASGTKPR